MRILGPKTNPLLRSLMQQAAFNFKCEMPQIGAKELAYISSYQTVFRGQKVKKLLSDHEARQKSWRICAPLVVKLLS